jgi:predicted lipoprotein with Yx(FWY)xxD motif
VGRAVASVLAASALGLGVEASVASGSTSLVVATRSTSTYGTILVAGHAVYTLKPSATPCHAACLAYWPAVLLPKGTTKAVAGPGVSLAKLGTHRLADGRLQVTYGGRALYYFALDKAANQVKGNVTDTWGTWRVVVTKKPAVTTTTTHTTTTTAAGGGGGIGF